MNLADLNTLGEQTAFSELLRCCGSSRWARLMAEGRPYATPDALYDRSDAVCRTLDRADWLEAFAAHPRIGAGGSGRSGGSGGSGRSGASGGLGEEDRGARWSREEQSGVRDDDRARLMELNRDYERRFGYIFIICATGKSGDEMRRALERRIGNNPDQELREAAEEQRRIARLRLARLLA